MFPLAEMLVNVGSKIQNGFAAQNLRESGAESGELCAFAALIHTPRAPWGADRGATMTPAGFAQKNA